MSFASTIFGFFGKVKGLLAQAWDLLKVAGVDDDVLAFAMKYIRLADAKFVDNDKRREWVVKALVENKIPESISRLVVEMAYQIYRKEKGKVGL